LIARVPEAPKWLGLPGGSGAAVSSRTYHKVSEIDGVSRIYSARPIPGTPLIAEVGLSTDEVLAGWRHELNVAVAILAAFSLATVLLTWLLMQGLIRRNEAARSVGRNERMLRQVFETLPVGVRVADKDGHVVLSNAASGRIWGDAEKDLHYFTDRKKELPHTADRGMALTLTRGESSRNEVLDVECSDGTRKTVLHSTAPIVSAEGEIVGGVAVNEDITEQRALVDTLRESEARYQALFEHSIDAVLLMRSDGRILSANEQACRLLGYN
jgi:PAS domain S-box-containing protein